MNRSPKQQRAATTGSGGCRIRYQGRSVEQNPIDLRIGERQDALFAPANQRQREPAALRTKLRRQVALDCAVDALLERRPQKRSSSLQLPKDGARQIGSCPQKNYIRTSAAFQGWSGAPR